MNKTISINLSGLLFNLEEGAYEQLAAYLKRLRGHFSVSEGRDEIIGDIESRIAELFTERLKQKQVILEVDVAEVIAILGQPEEYLDTEEEAESVKAQSESAQATGPRRLFRSADDGVLGGVCSGIGHYFGIDPIWLRVAFLVAFFFAGSGPVIYLILWIAIPRAVTTAEKLQMKGEPVTISNIERNIKEEIERAQKAAGEFTRRVRNSDRGRIGSFVSELFWSLNRLLNKLVKLLGRSLGVFLLLLGSLCLFIWFAVILGSGSFISINGERLGMTMPGLLDTTFSEPWHITMFMIGLALVTLSPILAMMLGGTRLLISRRFSFKWPARVNGMLFLLGLAFCLIPSVMLTRNFSSQARIIESVVQEEFGNDTLRVRVSPDSEVKLRHSLKMDEWKFYFNEDNPFITGIVKVSIAPTTDNSLSVKAERSAYGASKKEAFATAGNIQFFARKSGNTLTLHPYFKVKQGDKWRKQEIEFDIALPQGMYIFLEPTVGRLIEDVELDTETGSHHEITGHYWRSGKNGLECTDCYPTAES